MKWEYFGTGYSAEGHTWGGVGVKKCSVVRLLSSGIGVSRQKKNSFPNGGSWRRAGNKGGTAGQTNSKWNGKETSLGREIYKYIL